MASRSAAPTVSVGLPVYNGERYLEDALRSILAQSMQDLEVVVSDNASTDRSFEIVQDYARTDRRIRIERQAANKGAAYNYNRVFELSTGPYFRWAAADDLWSENLLSECLRALTADPAAVLAYPKTELIDAHDHHLSFYEDNLRLDHDDAKRRACAFIRRINLCNAVFGVYRRSALEKTKLIQTFAGSDAVLIFETAVLGKIVEVPEATFRRRVHKGASHESTKSKAALQLWFGKPNGGFKDRFSPKLRLLIEYLGVVIRHKEQTNRIVTVVSVLVTWCYRQLRVLLGRWRRRMMGIEVPDSSRRFSQYP